MKRTIYLFKSIYLFRTSLNAVVICNSGSRHILNDLTLKTNSILLHNQLIITIYSGALGNNNLQTLGSYKAPYLNSYKDFRLRFDFT